MKKFNEAEADEEAENPFWITYSDLLSSLLLVFLALLFAFQALSMIQAEQLKKQMENQQQTHAELEKLKAKLDADRRKFNKFLAELNKLQAKHKEIKVDPKTGDVTIETDDEWFDTNEDKLKPHAKEFLRRLMPDYVKLVTNQEYADTIKQVVVEGHADAEGSPDWETNYQANLTLSQKRACAVNQFVLAILENSATRERFRRLSSVGGRSNIQMILALEQKKYGGRAYTPRAPTATMLQTKGKQFRNVKLRLDWRNPIIEYDLILTVKEK